MAKATWNKTRFSMLFYKKMHDIWYLGMKSEGDDDVAVIGQPYMTKAELLADLEHQHSFRVGPLTAERPSNPSLQTIDAALFQALDLLRYAKRWSTSDRCQRHIWIAIEKIDLARTTNNH